MKLIQTLKKCIAIEQTKVPECAEPNILLIMKPGKESWTTKYIKYGDDFLMENIRLTGMIELSVWLEEISVSLEIDDRATD